MNRLYRIFIFLFISMPAFAQVTVSITPNIEQQLENATEKNEGPETGDDAYLQQMMQFIRDPINLNTADIDELKQLRLLTPIQVDHFMLYRSLVGKLVDLYELQAVPGWDPGTIQKIRPYVYVSLPVLVPGTLKNRVRGGDHHILIRASQVPERAKGYLLDPAAATNFYPGSPQKIGLRYGYRYKNLLQYGLVAEKDAGEQFFKGKQKQGFDFYSAHIFIHKIGIISALAIGDFTVNLGQGLTQWQSLAFKKSVEAIHIKRESEVLRPYNSSGEINFHRGAGITLAKKNWQLTLFGSYKNIDANAVTDTAQNLTGFVTSLQTSGYHRTQSESADKGVQRQLAFGGNFTYRNNRLHLGLNGIQYRLKLPLIKPADPYNKFAWSGSRFGNYSFDYGYTCKNIHFFGEVAFTSNRAPALISGMILSASSRVDLGILYRNISRSYQSLYTAAFTENTYPANEKGLYAGITIRPNDFWRIDAYADFYEFPWLRYRVNAPTTGSDYLVQLNYKPGKQLEVYTRFLAGSKAVNENTGALTLSPVVQQPKKNWRTQVRFKVNNFITLRSRTELVWFDKRGKSDEQGVLTYFDFIYEPLLKPYAGNLRLQYFETDGYNSRLYAYENDVLYYYSIPLFYDKGYRYYINMNYEINKKITLWIKWSQTIYKDKNLIGSGLDEIEGHIKSEIRVQAAYKF